MEEVKDFKGKKIKIRNLSMKDLKRVPDFLNFTNSLIDGKAKISINQRLNLKQEQKWLEEKLKEIKSRITVCLVAEYGDLIVGSIEITTYIGAMNHVGELRISIRDNYRRIGLGKYLMKNILKKTKTGLKKKPKIIRLSVFSNNMPAITLYQKIGFEIVAEVPKQMRYRNKIFSEIIMIKELK